MTNLAELFPTLPQEADVWAYTAERKLSEIEQGALMDLMSGFQQQWSSHGRTVLSELIILDQQILLIGAAIAQGDISGCGIDKSLNVLESFSGQHGFSWINSLLIPYRSDSGDLKIATRSEFRKLASEGRVHNQTRVLDVSVRRLEDFRSGNFEVTAGNSWHGKVFKLTQLQSAAH